MSEKTNKRKELEELLQPIIENGSKRIFLWGTGNTTFLYQEGLERLKEEGFEVCGYADNNSEMWGKTVFDKRVYSPSELVEEKDVLALITSPQPRVIHAVAKQLDELQIAWRHIDDYILRMHRSEVLRVYDLLEDEESRDLYVELICCRMEGRYPEERFVSKGQYFTFRDFVTSESRDVIVDCGAYVGDTLEQYIWRTDGQFRKYFAFEPDIRNVEAMKYRTERLKREWNISEDRIRIYPYAIGEKDQVSYVERYDANNGFGSKITGSSGGDLSEEIRCIAIDSFFNEKIDYLKADIESYEYKMLLGARQTIQKWKPKLAICIYHNIVDFYQIPLWIKENFSEYRISIRHYTKKLSETVLYAYTETE